MVVLMGFSLVGCPKKSKGPVVESTAGTLTTEIPVMTPADTAKTLDVGTQWATSPALFGTVLFDYMKAELTDASREILRQNASVLKAALKVAPGLKIRVEGHCDDRGTLEYNMVLGERRARVVRDYYSSLGVPRSSLSTISYGEENPVCREATENCWATNRRGETTLKSDAPIRIPLPN